MAQPTFRPEDFKPGRLTRAFALLSLVFVGVLASAPLRPYFAEWRHAQKSYNQIAELAGVAPVAVAIQQIWKPKLGITDRCVSCHLGMGNATPLPMEKLYRAHPSIPHDPKEFGCVVCHGGQGRATTKNAAHGLVSYWDEQMLDVRHQSAGCGTCHTSAPVIARASLDRGRQLVESLDCLSCHQMDGRGRGDAPNLSYAGLKGYRTDWHALHLKKRAEDKTGVWQSNYGAIPAADQSDVDAFLKTRVGAPRIIEAQALAFERGCLGCHKIQGRGGDEGPALDEAGRKPVGDLDFKGVPGARTLVNYMERHLLDPAGVVPGSQMPAMAVNHEEADLLTSYVLFLRRRDVPAEFTPKERLRQSLLGAKREALSGEQLFGAYCAGCHAPNGEGRNYGSIPVRFPRIGSADFLDIASAQFIESTIQTGRPGRKMAPLGGAGGSLAADEVKSIAAYLRGFSPAPSWSDVERASADRALGERTYRADCAACHGDRGEGTALGSPLASADSRTRGRREAVHKWLAEGVPGTAMPRYTGYDPTTHKSLVGYVSTLPLVPGLRTGWRPGKGHAANGIALYARNCAGCHGENGEGKLGPALANSGFQRAATDEFVAATIVRGRAGTPMPAFGRDSVNYLKLTADEVLDLVEFVRRGLGAKAAAPPAQGK
jgi:mono/diheme cytochrome c family protein